MTAKIPVITTIILVKNRDVFGCVVRDVLVVDRVFDELADCVSSFCVPGVGNPVSPIDVSCVLGDEEELSSVCVFLTSCAD